jgi:DNA-binding CsgD family transcriptional regulator/tetratricopeptide (TPR) repeat protein
VLRALLDAPSAQGASLPRARALAAAAYLLLQTGDYAPAEDYCREALAVARPSGDDRLVADVLFTQAWVWTRLGRPGAALRVAESGLDLARRIGDPHLVAWLLSVRASAATGAGDHAGAARDEGEAARLFRQAGDRLQMGLVLGNLGYSELSAGDLGTARRHLAEALDIAREFNERSGPTTHTFNLGLAEYLGGSPEAAAALFTESLDLARRTGKRSYVAYALAGLAMAGRGADRAERGWSARLHGAADQIFADLGHEVEELEARLVSQDRQRLRAAMGAEAFEAEYAAGRALDMPQVLAEFGRRAGAAARPAEPAAAGSPAAVTVLTARQLDVLRLVAQGLSNADIARRLMLSEHTVHRHLAMIRRKLGLSSRAAAVAWGVRAGLV